MWVAAPEQPAMTDACAGPWDIVATPWNATKIDGATPPARGGADLTTRLKALPADRCCRWSYRGSDTTLPVTAGGDCVHVRR